MIDIENQNWFKWTLVCCYFKIQIDLTFRCEEAAYGIEENGERSPNLSICCPWKFQKNSFIYATPDEIQYGCQNKKMEKNLRKRSNFRDIVLSNFSLSFFYFHFQFGSRPNILMENRKKNHGKLKGRIEIRNYDSEPTQQHFNDFLDQIQI